MKLITIHESENTLDAIDELVRQRVFNSRAEVYRTGALLMITVNSARMLARANRLEEKLYVKEVRRALSSVSSGDFVKASTVLAGLEEALRLKAVLDRVGGKDGEGLETLADGLRGYSQALSRADSLDAMSRERLVRDLQRDLQAFGLATKKNHR
jgi:Arc/MetJ-type ribon-helix-helix transcriptional regulator